MWLAPLAIVGCLACNSGTAKEVIAAPTTPPPAALPSSGASEPPYEGQPGCRFQRPAIGTGGRAEWLGGCHKGFAEGIGVIVYALEGAEPQRFYGQLESGSPSIGVLHTSGGFMAGRWNHGSVIADLPDGIAQRNVVIDAFRKAADAATAASRSFAKKGDADASRFYATQARNLDNQMD